MKVIRKRRKLKNAVINTITYIAAISMFMFIVFYGLSGQTGYIIGAGACWIWCLLYAWANGSFKRITK